MNSRQIKINEIFQIREKNREQRRLERDQEIIRNIESSRPRDALTDLFVSLCQKTCDHPKYLQLRVQREIFETITRAEEEALSYDLVNNCYCLLMDTQVPQIIEPSIYLTQASCLMSSPCPMSAPCPISSPYVMRAPDLMPAPCLMSAPCPKPASCMIPTSSVIPASTLPDASHLTTI